MTEYERLKAQKDAIVKAEHDKIFNSALEAAAKAIDQRVIELAKYAWQQDNDLGLSVVAEAEACAAAVRALMGRKVGYSGTCPECRGTCVDLEDSSKDCWRCHGAGVVREPGANG